MQQVVAVCDVNQEKFAGAFRHWEEAGARYSASAHQWERQAGAEFHRLLHCLPRCWKRRRRKDRNNWRFDTIIAKGGNVVLKINGVTMCELEDRDRKRLVHGWLALQVHVGPPMRVQFKDIYLRRL